MIRRRAVSASPAEQVARLTVLPAPVGDHLARKDALLTFAARRPVSELAKA